MKLKLLLVEDSPMLIRGLQYTLEQAGYDVVVCMSKHMADDRLARMQFDVAVLDVNLPDGSGFDLCRQLKEDTDIPVIFLTARDEENDVVLGFDLGADDYILKPFRNRELTSRIEAVLRRSGKTKKKLVSGDVEIDVEKDKVLVKGNEVEFTQLEYRILLMLMQNMGQTLTREQILDRIWDMAGNFVEDNTLTVYIKRIREKLGEADVIRTVKGIGYRVDEKKKKKKTSLPEVAAGSGDPDPAGSSSRVREHQADPLTSDGGKEPDVGNGRPASEGKSGAFGGGTDQTGIRKRRHGKEPP